MRLSSTVILYSLPLVLVGCGGNDEVNPAFADAITICASCHVMDKSKDRRLGPNLYGVVGRMAGTQAGFNYSTAMKNSGFVWTPEKLDAFLAAPQSVVPGNRMSYPGIRDPASRMAIIAALQNAK